MKEYTLKEITHEEYLKELRAELTEKGLKNSVHERLDYINHLSGSLPYLPHRHIQELMVEIEELIELHIKI